MAITSVTELSGRNATFGDDNTREYRRTFLVISDDKTTGPIAIRSELLIPNLFENYFLLLGGESDGGARVTSIEPQQDPDFPYRWEVSVTYSTSSEEEEQQDENPLLRPAEVTLSFENFREVAVGVLSGETNPNEPQFSSPLTNSAGDLFDPPAEMDKSRPVVTIARNEPNIDLSQLMDYADAVNSDPFLGAQPRQLRMSGPQAVRQHENNIAFWRVTYQMSFNRETWDLQVLNQGSKYYDGGFAPGKKKSPSKDDEGGHDMVNLDNETGDKLANDEPEQFLRFKVYKEKTFSQLGLASSIRYSI